MIALRDEIQAAFGAEKRGWLSMHWEPEPRRRTHSPAIPKAWCNDATHPWELIEHDLERIRGSRSRMNVRGRKIN